MESPPQVKAKFQVKFIDTSIVKAPTINPSESELQPPQQILNLSNLDLLSGRFPVTYFYIFPPPPLPHNFTTILNTLKTSLSHTLHHFFPFSGRIIQNPTTNEPEIVCNNQGALFVSAQSNIPLKELPIYDLDQCIRAQLVRIEPNFPLQIQATSYTCGGISITFTFDHALSDASGFGKFLLTWAQIATNIPISTLPVHRRNYLFHPRLPPSYHPSLDETFVKCTMDDIKNIPTFKKLLKRLYHIEASDVNKLQTLACEKGNHRTKIEAFSAYVWKIMVNSIDYGGLDSKCKMGWLVDGRRRMLTMDQNDMSNYIGNVLSVAFGEASVGELKRSSISEVAGLVHDAICKVTTEEHFLDLIDWVECHRPGLMLSRLVLGLGGPTLVLSSGRRFPVAELDFGFGSPLIGTVCSTVERIGVCYMNQRPSGRADGSWTVSTILWPELADALEADSIFQPMSATLLHL